MAVRRWYPSKIDWWLAVILAITPLACLATVIATVNAGSGVAVAVGSCVLIAVIYLGLVFPMRYGIDDNDLLVRHGLITQRIALRNIVQVKPTRNPLSSPALSLDRLEIKFGDGFFKSAMISPAAKADFLRELQDRANLRQQGDLLVR